MVVPTFFTSTAFAWSNTISLFLALATIDLNDNISMFILY